MAKKTDYPNLVPTPGVGQNLVWYPRAAKDNGATPAMCVAIESPGKIAVVVFQKNQMPSHKGGCRHIDDPCHVLKPYESVNGGGWDFVKVPEDPYQFDRDERDRRELARMEATEKNEEAARLRAEAVARAKEQQLQAV